MDVSAGFIQSDGGMMKHVSDHIPDLRCALNFRGGVRKSLERLDATPTLSVSGGPSSVIIVVERRRGG